MADIRLDGRPLPMENGSENAFVVEARNIITGCPSNNPCEGIHCNHPFECIDLWNLHECRYVVFFIQNKSNPIYLYNLYLLN